MPNAEGRADPGRLRAARRHRAHLLANRGERIQHIAERCGVTVAVAKQFLTEKIAPRTRAEPSEPSELPKGVRRVKGGAYQARPRIGLGRLQGSNVNLGLYHPEDYRSDGAEHRAIAEDQAIAAAAFAAKAFLNRMAWNPRPDIWDVIQKLQGERRRGYPVVPLHVLPPLVRRVFAPVPPPSRTAGRAGRRRLVDGMNGRAWPNDHYAGQPERELLGFVVGGRRPPFQSRNYPTVEEAWAAAKILYEEKARESCRRADRKPPWPAVHREQADRSPPLPYPSIRSRIASACGLRPTARRLPGRAERGKEATGEGSGRSEEAEEGSCRTPGFLRYYRAARRELCPSP